MAHLGDRVDAFVDGQLPDDEAARVSDHLGECPTCRELVQERRALKRRMTGLGPSPAPRSALLVALADPDRLTERDAGASESRIRAILGHGLARGGVALTGASVALAGLAYALGGVPTASGASTLPPVDRFIAQFRGQADPVALVRTTATTVHGSVPVAVVARRPAAPTHTDALRASEVLSRALGSSVSVRLLARNYDLSVVETAGSDRIRVVASADGVREATFEIDRATGALQRIVRFSGAVATDTTSRSGAAIGLLGSPLSREAAAPRDAPEGPSAAGGIGPEAVGATGDADARDTSVGDADPSEPDTGAPTDDTADPVATPVDAAIDSLTMQDLSDGGWPCHDVLGSGFARVGAEWVAVDGERAIALTYSDGATTMTLYEQNGALMSRPDPSFTRSELGGRRVWLRDGSPTVATWSADGIVFTAVTDGEAAQIESVVHDLPGTAASRTDAWHRVRSGLVRLSSWASPGDTPAG
ncbi:putative zinc finger protein [Mumia flava]|uniref:Putative zinc finger protein n=1 Tax=Mumia flava TaxID=1348852 RepID=A0A0B2B799_9ACTN|nr:zf-HC2 domain-containing protein [Mumia flava]PJJ56708.1 putative zinc finger protein [Mumia flava]